MHKKEYLDNVAAFVTWLARQLKNRELTHRYSMPGNVTWAFNGLEDAFQQYRWNFQVVLPNGTSRNGECYPENAKALAELREGLRAALVQEENDKAVCNWACAVMKWGGVTNGNVAWLEKNMVGLAREIQEVMQILEEQDDDRTLLKPIRRFNAGMTKVYSLLIDDFIIYDSRVAAALAWLVMKWCQEQGVDKVPDMLAFPCMPPKETENAQIKKVRNPSAGNRVFPAMNNNARRHALWNLRASWILAECLNQANGTMFHAQGTNRLRALEAALFMWGYDLSASLPNGGQNDADEEAIANATRVQDNIHQEPEQGHPSLTLGNASSEFSWVFDIDRDSLRVIVADGTEHVFSTAEIFAAIHWLYDRFGYEWFPLANNVAAMADRRERDGLGMALYSRVPDTTHAQKASQLGPILMQYEMVEWNHKRRGINFRLIQEPPLCIEDLRMLLASR